VAVAVQGWEFDVKAGVDCLGSCVSTIPSGSVVTAELLHREIVGHDDPVEAELVPQEIREDRR
jgi:hypothetical protein